MATPKLHHYIRDARYIFHEHGMTDHASLIFTIDIENADMGPGVFCANPNLLNHPNYKALIDNVIRYITIYALADKESPLYHKLMSNFIDKINVQEEIVSLEIVREQ